MARKPEVKDVEEVSATAAAEVKVEESNAGTKLVPSLKKRLVVEVEHDFVTIKNEETGRTRVCDRPDLAFFKKQGYTEVKAAE